MRLIIAVIMAMLLYPASGIVESVQAGSALKNQRQIKSTGVQPAMNSRQAVKPQKNQSATIRQRLKQMGFKVTGVNKAGNNTWNVQINGFDPKTTTSQFKGAIGIMNKGPVGGKAGLKNSAAMQGQPGTGLKGGGLMMTGLGKGPKTGGGGLMNNGPGSGDEEPSGPGSGDEEPDDPSGPGSGDEEPTGPGSGDEEDRISHMQMGATHDVKTISKNATLKVSISSSGAVSVSTSSLRGAGFVNNGQMAGNGSVVFH